MTHRYDDIIDLPHFVSENRHHMSNYDRAAQFAPFAALTGYDAIIRQRDEIYLPKKELTEDELAVLDNTIHSLQKNDLIEVVYYSDGSYLSLKGHFRLIDTYRHQIDIDHHKIALDDIEKIRLLTPEE